MKRAVHWALASFVICTSTVAVAAESSVAQMCGECRVEKFATCGGFLEGSTVAPDGGLWVLDLIGDRLLSITEKGECVVRGKTGGRPNGAKFHKDGRLFITGSQGLLAFDPRNSSINVLVDKFEGKPLEGLNDLAFDSSGGLYFTVPGNSGLLRPEGRVFYLAPGSTTPVLMTDKIAFPNGIAVSQDGRAVLVAEFAAKRVLSLPTATVKGGIALAYIYANTVGGVGPDGIAVDAKGRLLAANLGTGEVLVFASDGRPIGSIRLPDDAGKAVTNLVVKGEYLYITEAAKGEIWRTRLEK